MRTGLFIGCMLMLAGCDSGPRHVPVSGVVTLNGKPLPDALVSFQMIVETEDPLKATPRGLGKTTANGSYTLKSTTGRNGVIPGKYKVMFVLVDPATTTEKRPASNEPFTQLPERYNADSRIICDVPSSGKRDADYELTSP
jgi:hypothetical protein